MHEQARAGLRYGAIRREQGPVVARAGGSRARAGAGRTSAGLINFLRGERIPEGQCQPADVKASTPRPP
jgi:hypothetical protein